MLIVDIVFVEEFTSNLNKLFTSKVYLLSHQL